MLHISSIEDYLRNKISLKRFNHSINVSTVAVKLAEFYGCDVEKACIAGLVHDCAREQDVQVLMEYITKEHIIVDSQTISVKELLHGPAAVYVCRKEFGIEDEDILNAVRYHTTGRENMTLLEKVIYLSDFIEPSRSFEGVEELRRLAFENLNEALLSAFDSSIRYIISKNGLLHVDTILSRNFILKELQML